MTERKRMSNLRCRIFGHKFDKNGERETIYAKRLSLPPSTSVWVFGFEYCWRCNLNVLEPIDDGPLNILLEGDRLE